MSAEPLFRFLGIRRGIAVLGLRSMRGVAYLWDDMILYDLLDK